MNEELPQSKCVCGEEAHELRLVTALLDEELADTV